MKSLLAISLISLICSSCATLFNSPKKQVQIITDTQATIVVDSDTLKSTNNQTSIEVIRKQEPISLIVFNDTLSKNISIEAKNSFAFWSNLGVCYGLGMLIDMDNPKRYTYPNTIYLSMKNYDTNYSTVDNEILKNKYILKLTPLKITGLFSPGIEVSCEKSTGNYLATQIMASMLLPSSAWKMRNDFNPEINGFRIAIEEKYYFKKSSPIGPYTSLELNYMKNKYRDIERFVINDNYSDTTYFNSLYVDSIGIKKQTLSVNLKFGYQYFIKRFSFDFYIGIGIRYKDVKHFDRIDPEDEMEIPREPDIYYISNQKGHFWTLCMPMNFRIGWTL